MNKDNDIAANPQFTRAVAELAQARRFDAPVYVTRPNIPSLERYMQAVAPAWQRQWLTNDGVLHGTLESALAQRFHVPCFRLFCNGTVALLTALHALGVEDGEAITTPFTFPATVHALHWRRLRPVFGDIQRHSCNLDPDGIEALITPQTRLILPVHVYGLPCDIAAIQSVADRHGLPVLYDAAHAFDAEYDGASVLRYGAMSMLSFHATKLFTTAEGGALASPEPAYQEKVRLLKNFGIADEATVLAPGINGKMSELHAALGLTQLDTVADEIVKRKHIADRYTARLAAAPGLTTPTFETDKGRSNRAYYPLRVDAGGFGMSRDMLHELLQRFNVHARRYFHPLCSSFPWQQTEPRPLPEAEAAAREMLCLPLYGALSEGDVDSICDILLQMGALARECL